MKKKKAPTKKRAVKTVTKTSNHTDKNSHNYNISISGLKGSINKSKDKIVNDLKNIYGKYATQLLTVTKKAEKNKIVKAMRNAKSEITKLRKSK